MSLHFIMTAMLTLFVACALATAPPKPHLIFVMVDDWGWYNVGFRGNFNIKTPVMDSLVRNDALLLDRHYAFKYCSPTRRSFLSGRQPTHSGEDNSASATVDLRMKTIADKLTSGGYSSHQAGKWHAGHDLVFQAPTGRGFNTSLGYFNGACDHFTQKDGEDGCGEVTDLWDSYKPGFGMNGTYGDYLYAGRAVDTIMRHDQTTPLFFYLALQCAHDPMESPQRFQDLYSPATCPDVVEYSFSSVIDEAIGNVTAALKAKNMWENTLMVVSSDNGGPAFSDQHAASNFPLRGGKYTLFEGGLRVSAFVTGGVLPVPMRGKNITAPIHICDWYATFSTLAGVDPADNHDGIPQIDGIDQWPVISGATTTPPRTEIFPASGVLIQNQWKLIDTSPGNAMWSGPLYPKVKATGPKSLDCKPCLFDVVADPGEHNEVSGANPDIVKTMSARLAVLMATVFAAPTANVTKGAVCAATAKNGGFLTPSDWNPTLAS
eukprot:m.17406 g.17406  ORF g.17406 m.17406 type:complete len:490 (+) comp11501_c0_seq1:50-1519(+)